MQEVNESQNENASHIKDGIVAFKAHLLYLVDDDCLRIWLLGILQKSSRIGAIHPIFVGLEVEDELCGPLWIK